MQPPERRALFDSCLNRLTVANVRPMSLGEGAGRAGRRLVSMIHAGPHTVQAGELSFGQRLIVAWTRRPKKTW